MGESEGAGGRSGRGVDASFSDRRCRTSCEHLTDGP